MTCCRGCGGRGAPCPGLWCWSTSCAVTVSSSRDGSRRAASVSSQPRLDCFPATRQPSAQQLPGKASVCGHQGCCCCRGAAEGHTFGVPSARGELGVDALLRGDYSPEQLQADASLGKSVKEGWRNLGPADRVSHFSQHMPAARSMCIALCPLYLAGLPGHIDLQAWLHPDTFQMWLESKLPLNHAIQVHADLCEPSSAAAIGVWGAHHSEGHSPAQAPLHSQCLQPRQ